MIVKPASHAVLHWEWRTFAHDLAGLRARLPELAKLKRTHSRETYIVSELVPHNAKIRFDELDVRRLLHVDAQGLELWDPVLEGTFPITAETAARMFHLWRLPLPAFEREHYSLTLFLEEVVSRNRDLHLAEVEKTRCGFEYRGCTAELAELAVNGIPLETFCLEHEDGATVCGALDRLGLRGARNVSYPQAIKEVLGLTTLPAPVHEVAQ